MDVLSKIYGDGLRFRLQAVISKFKAWKNPLERARASHVAVDQVIADALEKTKDQVKPSCGKGCGYCCHQNVIVSNSEKALILRHMDDQGISLGFMERARLRTQRMAMKGDSWDKLKHDDKKCIFLGDNSECKIYAVRPMVCRGYMVVSPKEQCNHRFNVQRVEIIQFPEADLMTAASFLADEGNEKTLTEQFYKEFK